MACMTDHKCGIVANLPWHHFDQHLLLVKSSANNFHIIYLIKVEFLNKIHFNAEEAKLPALSCVTAVLVSKEIVFTAVSKVL